MFPISDSIKSYHFPFITIFLIAVTVFVFFLQITASDQNSFISSYALIASSVSFSNYLTLIPFITSIFLHGGFLHILSNMAFLWVFGDNVESRFGWIFFPLLYLTSGLVGGVSQYLLMPDSSIPMLGASGAVAGVLGAYFVLFPSSRIKTLVPFFGFFSIVHIPASLMLGYWFFLQIISGAVTLPMMGENGGVAFFAHIGGFVTGIAFAKIFRPE